jgi:cytohesin
MKSQLIAIVAAVLLVGCGGPSASELALLNAAEDGNIIAVKRLLAAGVNVNAVTYSSETPLHFAAIHGYKEVAELLIEKGADVNAKGVGGRTPLHWAANRGHREVAELLIAKGAEVNAMDVLLGWTPLDYAEGETAALLRKHGGKTGEELKAEGK